MNDSYWADNMRLYELALRAARTGESLDQLFFASTDRSSSARSEGNFPHRPSIRKSIVTSNRSTKSAAIGSVKARLPFSKRDQ